MQPLTVLQEAIRAVPAVRYALGVAGIVAVVALVRAFRLDFKVAIFGTITTLAFMVALVVFAKLTTTAKKHFLGPVLIMMWAFLIMVISSAALLFSSVFFDQPKEFSHWLFPNRNGPVPPAPEVPPELMSAARKQSETGDYAGLIELVKDASLAF